MPEHERGYRRPHAAADVAEVRHWRFDGYLYPLRHPAINDGHRPELPLSVSTWLAPAKKSRHFVQRSLRRRQPDPLRRARDQLFEALEGQRQVGAPFYPGYRVNFIDDYRCAATSGAFLREPMPEYRRFGRLP